MVGRCWLVGVAEKIHQDKTNLEEIIYFLLTVQRQWLFFQSMVGAAIFEGRLGYSLTKEEKKALAK